MESVVPANFIKMQEIGWGRVAAYVAHVPWILQWKHFKSYPIDSER